MDREKRRKERKQKKRQRQSTTRHDILFYQDGEDRAGVPERHKLGFQRMYFTGGILRKGKSSQEPALAGKSGVLQVRANLRGGHCGLLLTLLSDR